MTIQVMSPSSSPVVSPRTSLPFSPTQPTTTTSPTPNNARISLPPTQNLPHGQDSRRRSTLDRPSSYARDRMSAYSVRSNASSRPSRSASSVFPFFPSSLSYTQVRDFAYQANNPLHYGPPPDASAPASGQSTPALEAGLGFVSDYPQTPLALKTNWSETSSGGDGQQLAPMAYGDSAEDHGPPYSEDEDLHSPVVISSHSTRIWDDDRGYFTGTNGDGSENYYLSDPAEEAGGPGGVVETYSSEQARHSSHSRHMSHTLDASNTYYSADPTYDGQTLGVGAFDQSSNRLSRDYSFTIASPDEEMHGKAVALFDFQPENDNELPLVEGQVIWVSYRNGQGWLVAEDPKSRETGLVPEEYVRLFRHIENSGWQSLAAHEDLVESTERMALSPISEPGEPEAGNPFSRKQSAPTAVQSTFSTSSKDLEPYPHPLPIASQAPPQIVHQRTDSQNQSIAEVLSPVSAASLLSPKSLPSDEQQITSPPLDRRKSTDSAKGNGKAADQVGRKTSKSSRKGSKNPKS